MRPLERLIRFGTLESLNSANDRQASDSDADDAGVHDAKARENHDDEQPGAGQIPRSLARVETEKLQSGEQEHNEFGKQPHEYDRDCSVSMGLHGAETKDDWNGSPFRS